MAIVLLKVSRRNKNIPRDLFIISVCDSSDPRCKGVTQNVEKRISDLENQLDSRDSGTNYILLIATNFKRN